MDMNDSLRILSGLKLKLKKIEIRLKLEQD